MSFLSLITPPLPGSSAGSAASLAVSPTPVGAAVAAVGLIGGIAKALSGNSKDPQRLNSNAAAYARALAGDQGAIDYLKYRSGQFGTGTTTYRDANQTGASVGGWATQVAMDDAYQKYQSAAARFGQLPTGAALPYTPAAPASPGTATGTPTVVKAGVGSLTLLIVASAGLFVIWKLMGSPK